MSAGDWIVVGILLVIPGAVMAALFVCVAITVLSDLFSLVAWLCGLARIKRRRYKRTIANIARLERELGIDGQDKEAA